MRRLWKNQGRRPLYPHTKRRFDAGGIGCLWREPPWSKQCFFPKDRTTTTKLKSESTGGNAFSISSRFVTPFPACILRTFATALRALYGIVLGICRTLINQTGADRWHIFICMGFHACLFPAAKDRYFATAIQPLSSAHPHCVQRDDGALKPP